ncbi:MAG TPA: hypothetical protein VEQ11_21290 [Chloroflexota bacterium]|nr:hypothetical protein [Chloroflexota bacterium]
MEGLIVLVILIALDAAALRWGCNSSERVRTKEQALAGYGVTWREPAD